MTVEEVDQQMNEINRAAAEIKRQLDVLRAESGSISVADMFQMQLLMNHLSQLSEMSTSIVSAANSAIMSMARNVKS